VSVNIVERESSESFFSLVKNMKTREVEKVRWNWTNRWL